ncbi:hypothetical protein OG948_58880 (plasmid) [Embleya sp. NBC_00888]|uniref:hypothetical protein n=1 Tax=Embleya sp. NBC_00888 TaxID=2975960 RepID=UPI002F919C44|nr:hypothetical protein OG948_58880 [Embleya sp. NBC_00888]
MEVLPNGVTGARHTLPDLPEPDFTLVDVPFQIGAEGLHPARMLRDRVRSLDLRRAALIVTASKDLSLPGLRAALVVSRNRPLLEHLSRDRFERMATSGNPIGETVMLFHTSLLPVLEASAARTRELVETARDRARRARLPDLPDERTYRDVRDHLTAMGERFRRNARALEDPQSPLRPITGVGAATGFSAFAELAAPRGDFLRWVTRCGGAGLRLNPTVVHGGTSAAWEGLYPGGQLLRVNLSEDPVAFDRGPALLRSHVEHSGGSMRPPRASVEPRRRDGGTGS